jgi:hypothetical protein
MFLLSVLLSLELALSSLSDSELESVVTMGRFSLFALFCRRFCGANLVDGLIEETLGLGMSSELPSELEIISLLNIFAIGKVMQRGTTIDYRYTDTEFVGAQSCQLQAIRCWDM